MMHEEDGGVEVALEVAQIGEHRGDLRGGVHVDAVQAHEGIEHEQRGPQGGDRLAQALLVLGQIQAEGRGGDDLQVERLEPDAGGPGNTRQARAHDVEGVFGGEEEHAPGAGRRLYRGSIADTNGRPPTLPADHPPAVPDWKTQAQEPERQREPQRESTAQPHPLCLAAGAHRDGHTNSSAIPSRALLSNQAPRRSAR